MKYDGTSWVLMGDRGFTEGATSNPKIVLDSQDTPYIVFTDISQGNKATVMRFNGSSWELVGSAGFSAGIVYLPTIALDSQDTPYVLYRDGGFSDRATVMKYDGSSWVYVGDGGFSGGDKVDDTMIVLDSQDTPYVVYRELGDSGEKVTVKKFNGSSWVNVGSAGFSAGGTNFASIALDSHDMPYVAYEDTANAGKATVMKYDGSDWVPVGAPGFSPPKALGSYLYPWIALDSQDTPNVVFQDADNSLKATVMKYDGSNWVTVGNPGFSAGEAKELKIAIDSNDVLYVLYRDVPNESKLTLMKYVPFPRYTASASAASATPATGADHEITLTVKNSSGATDQTFNGVYNVTVSGYAQAPDGSYGSFNGTELTEGPNTISVLFTNGAATANLKLNKAGEQTIGFSVEDVATPDTNAVNIAPAAVDVASMVLTTDIAAPTSNGGAFAQQPVVTLYDAFGNISTGNSHTVVAASKKDSGAWTLTGTTAVTASEGVAAFHNLGATNAAEVTEAQLAFDAADLTQLTSETVTLPWPEVTAPSVAVTAGDSRVRLTWGEVYGTVNYAVFQRTASDAYGDAIAEVSGTTYDVVELTNGTKYYFVVKAMNPAGISDASNEVSATPRVASVPVYIPEQPSVPSEQEPDTQEPDKQEPVSHVYNTSIVNEADLVRTIASGAEEAKGSNAAMDFADTQGHWAEKTIDTFVKLKLIHGYEDGTFRPNSPITRAEFAAILGRVFQFEGGSTSKVLTDIDGNWAKDDIEKLAAAGVISGYPDNTFRPHQTITREEMVVMLFRIVDLDGIEKDATKGHFEDLEGSFAAEQVEAAAQAGIVSGKGDGRFDPKGSATRSEALQMILNVLKLQPELKTLLESLIQHL